MRGITEGRSKQAGKMKELVVRAGKYFSVLVIFIACLPVLLPFLFVFSIFGFTFLLPLGCALAGLLFLRKYVGMLCRKLPIPTILSGGCSSWGGRRQRLPAPAAPTTFIELPLSDLQESETFEAVDPEFDAVVVSTAPREVGAGSSEGENDPDIRSGSEAVSVEETSPGFGIDKEAIDDVKSHEDESKTEKNDGTQIEGLDYVKSGEIGRKIEGNDAETFVQDGTAIEGHDGHGTLVENGTSTEVREDDTSGKDGTTEGAIDENIYAERIDEDVYAVDEARKEGIGGHDDDVTLVENGTRTEVREVDTSAEDLTREEGIDEDTSPVRLDDYTSAVGEARKKGIDEDTSAENWKRREGLDEDIPAEDGGRSEGLDEDLSVEDGNGTRTRVREVDTSAEDLTREGVDEDTSPVRLEDDTSPVGEVRKEGIDEDTSAEDWRRREGLDEDIPAEDGERSEGLDEALSVEDGNGTRTGVREVDTSAEDLTRKEGVDEDTSPVRLGDDTSPVGEVRKEGIDEDTSAEDWRRREGLDEDIPVEDGERLEGLDEDLSVEDGTGREGIIEDTSAEDETSKGVIDEDRSAEDVKTREGLDEDLSVEDGTGRDGIIEDTSAEDETSKEVTDEDRPAEDVKTREGLDEDVSVEDGKTREELDQDISVEIENRREGIIKDSFSEEETRKEDIDEDTSAEGETRNEGLYDDTSAEGGNVREGEDKGTTVEDDARIEVGDDGTSIENGIRREIPVDDGSRQGGQNDDGHLEGEKGGIVIVGEGEKEEKQEGVEVKHLNEDKVEKNAERDDDFHTFPTISNYERSVGSPEDVNTTSGFTEIKWKGKEDEAESRPDDTDQSEAVIEEQVWKDKEINNQGLAEETKEQKIEAPLPDERVMRGELDSDDEERASVSSSTTRGGITPDASLYNASEEETSMKPDRVRNLLPHQANEDDSWTCKECGWKYPNAKPSAKIRRNHKKHCKGRHPSLERFGEGALERLSSSESNIEGDKFISAGKADDPSILDGEGHSKQVAFGDNAAVSSALSEVHEEGLSGAGESESFRSVANEFPPVASESFRSAPDDFPVDRWSSLDTHYDDERDQLAQVQQELDLTEDLNAVKEIVGDKNVSTGPLLTDIEELSEFLGIDLPARTADMPEIDWAKLAIEVMKVVVGID